MSRTPGPNETNGATGTGRPSGRTVIVVLDGFGVGAMPDAGALRPGDRHADTCGHVLDHCREQLGRPLRLRALGALGLGLVHPHPDLAAHTELPVAFGRAALGYPGADTFAGHQTMMGADFSRVTVARLGEHLDEVTDALRRAGHSVATLDGKPLLVVDGAVLVHDNLEADPGINWNASGRLEDLPFSSTLSVARVVRAVAPVARVIAVGGHAAEPLEHYVREGDAATVGLDTPATGFYKNGGLEVQHLGAPLDHTRQLPELAARAGVPVTLVGKAADILECESALRRPAVPTIEVLGHTLDAVRTAASGPSLVVANVQETDLAGHQQDTARYGEVLEQADAGLAQLLEVLDSPGDRLIVTGDHGNDPTIGHAYHTREYVPVLVHRPEATARRHLPDARTLADVGATAATSLGLPPTGLANGTTIL
ncbi:Phosphopentomutase [Streptomyces sp. YIM 130001]|uniref:phosphopentomutase n=1 Tax=Streptomyces sp. YIM 130001 TaxID=2259644 RepID=UPI000E65A3B9|nr:phosphopentomutase [Streptomyces sp. YIM 130001]RII09559.1 Phosphopentomutase [Streptomyces sp. YIM 130001]